MKSRVKFGHKIQAMRMCTLGRCGPWRFGLTLTVSANRDTVCKTDANQMLKSTISDPQRIHKGTLWCNEQWVSWTRQWVPWSCVLRCSWWPKRSSRGAMGRTEGENTMSFTTHRVIQTDRLGGMICPQQWRTTFISLGFGRLSDMCTHIHMCMHMCTHAGSRCLSPAAGLSTSRLLSMFWLLTGDSKGGPGFFLMLLTWAGVGFFFFFFLQRMGLSPLTSHILLGTWE